MTDHFVNTHVHTAFSLLDSVVRIPTLVKRIVELGQSACAITDHGTLAGAVKFTSTCLKNGIKPLIGQEFYIAPDSRLRKKYAKGENSANHLILFAKNEAGWQNIMKLSSIGFTEGFYKKPRIDKEVLEQYSDGLIVTSACIGGDIAKYLKAGFDTENEQKVEYSRVIAMDNARWYMDLFEDDFYFEMQSYGADYQEQVNEFYRRNFPSSQLIASADCHYVFDHEADIHDTLIACQAVRHKTDPVRWRFVADTFFVKSEEEMLRNFYPEEVYNTGRLADKITFELPLKKQFFMPELPADIKGEDANETFKELCLRGMYERIGYSAGDEFDVIPSYEERLNYEMDVFIKAGYVEYALLLWDLRAWCHRQDIFCGPGRGSGAGSLVLYSLRITDVDPIARNCPFERFINAGRLERFSPPDVDLDFPQSKRGAVIAYLRERYGNEHVCQIGTYASLGPAAIIRKLKVPLGLSEDDVADLTRTIPPGEGSVQGRGAAGDIGSSVTIEDVCRLSEAFKKKIGLMGYQGAQIMQYGQGLAYLGDHASTHASGLIIANKAVDTLLPLMSVKGNADERDVMSQIDMSDVELLGCVKFDILGLTQLDSLAYTAKQIRLHHDPSFDFNMIWMDDPAPYRLLHESRTTGIFQAEGGGFGALMPQARPQSVEELAVLTSLCRPGPMQAGITKTYIERKQGRQEVTYDIPELAPILGRSLGCIVFQEDIMEIASKLAGYTLAEADDLRKIMGKKQRDLMPAQKEKFITGIYEVSGVDEIRAERLWDQLEMMAEYVFNRSHAMAYSYLTAWTVWAKFYYPAYFLAAAMTSEAIGDSEELPSLMQDAKYLSVPIRRPDINESDVHFHAIEGQVRVGLRGIRGVGPKAAEAILEERKIHGPYLSRDDFRDRLPKKQVNSAVVDALERCGAFDQMDDRVRRVTVESLLEEFDLFGFFLSGHPCERLRALWRSTEPNVQTIEHMLTSNKKVQVSRKTQYGLKKEWQFTPVLIRGIVSKYDSKKSKSKTGSFLYFFDVEDETGTAKVFLNTKQYIRLGIESIKKGMSIEIFGSRSSRPSQVGYIDPVTIRLISFVG